MPERQQLSEIVRYAYHNLDVNCAKTTLMALSRLFGLELAAQVLNAATAMNGAGRQRGQCGLVEGALMFMGIYFAAHGLKDDEVVNIAGRFVTEFSGEFGSISCRELRPGGFNKSDPPHLCEGLTVNAINFSRDFIRAEALSRGSAPAV